MKKKYLAAILGVMMAATSVTVCGGSDNRDNNEYNGKFRE